MRHSAIPVGRERRVREPSRVEKLMAGETLFLPLSGGYGSTRQSLKKYGWEMHEKVEGHGIVLWATPIPRPAS